MTSSFKRPRHTLNELNKKPAENVFKSLKNKNSKSFFHFAFFSPFLFLLLSKRLSNDLFFSSWFCVIYSAKSKERKKKSQRCWGCEKKAHSRPTKKNTRNETSRLKRSIFLFRAEYRAPLIFQNKHDRHVYGERGENDEFGKSVEAPYQDDVSNKSFLPHRNLSIQIPSFYYLRLNDFTSTESNINKYKHRKCRD